MSFTSLSNKKKQLNNIKSYLLEIVAIYEEIVHNNENNDILDNVFNNIKDYNIKIDEINISIQEVNEMMISCCEHEFIDDSIDINCEKSQNIRYCSICEYTL